MSANPSSRSRAQPPGWQATFLRALAETGVVTAACRAAKIGRSTVYRLRQQDAEFAEAFQLAVDLSVEDLEAQARQRATQSDRLLMFLLKAERPEKYGDRRRVEVAGHLEQTCEITAEQLADPELAAAARLLITRLAGGTADAHGPGLPGQPGPLAGGSAPDAAGR